MSKQTSSTRIHADDLYAGQTVPTSPVFVVRDSQPSDDQSQQKQPMWKRTGNSKWDTQNNDAQTNRAGKWKSQP
jgi:hypothetical protein